MDTKVSILDVVIFLGILQAIAAIVIIFALKRKNIVSYLFCLTLFFFILINFKIQLHTLNIWQIPHLAYFPLAIDLLLQPTFYLYFLAISSTRFVFDKKYLLHYLPCLIFMIHAIVVYLAVIGVSSPVQKAVISNKFYYNQVKQFEDYLSVISSFAYCFLAFKSLRISHTLAGTTSDRRDESKDRWLKNIIALFFIFSVFLAVNITLETVFKLGEHTFLHWTLFYTYLSGFLYYISITIIRLPEIAILPISVISKKVDKDKIFTIAAKLKEIIERQKLYLIPDLTINDLAKKMNISASSLSYVINAHFNSTYRDFINDHKIREVKDMLLRPSSQHLSILGIASEAGFSSEASFYRIFKSKVGMSPKEFREQSLKKKV